MGTPLSFAAAVGIGPTRRVLVAAAFVAAFVAGLTAAVAGFVEQKTADRRVAIRIDCEQSATACAIADTFAVDVWSEQRGDGLPLDLVVHESFLVGLQREAMHYTVLDADIDATAEAEADRLSSAATVQSTDTADAWFAEFRDTAAIEARLRALAEQYPQRVTLHEIGTSVAGRPLLALRIGGGSDGGSDDDSDDDSGDDAVNADATKPVPMLVNGTQHAREWIAAMTATCVADRLVRDYDSDDRVRAFVDGTELWIVPVVNPDGYQYSWDKNRYWRKNRRGDHGVDLNRNYGVAWGGKGSSGSKRSDVYHGPRAFSEPETTALKDLAARERVKLHVDFHAYGQLVLFPWNHSPTRTDDHARYAAVGDTLASAIFAEHQTRYRMIRGVELYPASGTMTDYMYGEAKAMSFTIELRPRSGTGFVLPPSEIRPTCDEGLAAVLALRASLP